MPSPRKVIKSGKCSDVWHQLLAFHHILVFCFAVSVHHVPIVGILFCAPGPIVCPILCCRPKWGTIWLVLGPNDLSKHKMNVPVALGTLALILSWVEDQDD